MYVNEQSARRMLTSMGIESGDGVSRTQLVVKLNDLSNDETLDRAEEPKGEDFTLFESIVNSLKSGEEIHLESSHGAEVEEEEEAEAEESNGNGNGSSRSSRKSSNGRKKNKKSKEKKEATKDDFGCRIGGVPAKINAVLTNRPQTPEEIAKRIRVPVAKVKAHCRYWSGKERRRLIKTEDGFALKK